MALVASSCKSILWTCVSGFTLLVSSVSVVSAQQKDSSANETWHPIGFNQDRVAAAWVQLKSYEELNENSFRMNAKFSNDKGGQLVGRIDLNCKNKDYYFRTDGFMFQRAPWASVPQGSGIDYMARLYCKRTAAKAEWGYAPETAYLWNAPVPEGDPANAKGDWIKAYDGDDRESYYNNRAVKQGDVITYAFYNRAKKGDRSAAQPGDTAAYGWMRNSCKENLGSFFYKPDLSVQGEWLPPQPGRPGGANMIVRKEYCK